MVAAYFRSQSIPVWMRKWLLLHFVYCIGLVLIVAGVALRYIAVLTLKKAFILSVQTTKNQHLLTTGLYHTVRNPAYTGSITCLLGGALAYRHILGVIFVLLLCFVCYGIRIDVEEKALKVRFKEKFEQDCTVTKLKLIPFIY